MPKRKITETRKKATDIIIQDADLIAKRLQHALDAAKGGTLYYNIAQDIVTWDDRSIQMFGLTRDRFDGTFQAWEKCVHPDDLGKCNEEMRNALESKDRDLFDFEYRVIWPSGEIRYIQVQAWISRNMKGEPVSISGLHFDITDRINVIKALEKSQIELEMAQEVGHVGSWRYDVETNLITGSKEAKRQFQLDIDKISPEQLDAFIIQEDDTTLFELYQETLESGKKFNLDYKIKWENGELHWLNSIGKPEYDQNGKPVAIIGTTIDITERKRAEESLRHNEEMFSNMFELSPIPMVITNSDMMILQINKIFTDIFGYTIQDIWDEESWWPKVYPNPKYLTKIQRIWEKVLEKTKAENRSKTEPVEVLFTCKDGTVRNAVTTLTFIGDQNLVVYQDITAQRQSEQLLKIQRDLAVTLGQSKGLKRTLEVSLEAAINASMMDCGGVYLFHPVTQSLNLHFNVGLSKSFLEKKSHFEPDSPNVKAVMGGKPIYTHYSLIADPDDLDIEELKAIAIVPILHHDKAIGCLNVASHFLDYISDNSRLTLETIAGQIGQAISREQALDLLREREENLSVFFDSVTDFLLVLDERASIIRFNSVVKEKLGFTELDLVGQSVLDIHPASMREETAKKFNEIIQGQSSSCNIPIITNKGIEIPVETKVTRGKWNQRDAFFCVSRDISKRLKAEKELFDSQKRLAKAEEMAHLGSWEMDINNGKCYWSDEFFRICGYDPGELEPTAEIGMKLIHPEDQEKAGLAVQKAIETKSNYDVEKRIIRPDGSIRFVHSVGEILVDENNNPLKLVGSFLDITDRKKTEQDRLEFERQYLQAQKFESLGVLAGGIAHNFNNAMLVVMGNLELAQNKLSNNNPSYKVIKNAEKAAQRAAELSKLMLVYVGQGQEQFETFALETLIIHEWTNLKSKAPDCVKFVLIPDEKGAILIHGRKTQLIDILHHVTMNSIEATSKTGGEIQIAIKEMDLDAETLSKSPIIEKPEPGRFVCLTIKDEGCGMSSETKQRMFEPFFTTKFAGRGLGLAAVLGIVRGHKGAILVKSKENEGTEFTIAIPTMDNDLNY